MKGKYISTQIWLACLSKPRVQKDIHEQLRETIAARKKILAQLQQSFEWVNVVRMIDRKAA
jgi:hypothetical protein